MTATLSSRGWAVEAVRKRIAEFSGDACGVHASRKPLVCILTARELASQTGPVSLLTPHAMGGCVWLSLRMAVCAGYDDPMLEPLQVSATCTRDARKMHARCATDAREMHARCAPDARGMRGEMRGEMRARHTPSCPEPHGASLL